MSEARKVNRISAERADRWGKRWSDIVSKALHEEKTHEMLQSLDNDELEAFQKWIGTLQVAVGLELLMRDD